MFTLLILSTIGAERVPMGAGPVPVEIGAVTVRVTAERTPECVTLTITQPAGPPAFRAPRYAAACNVFRPRAQRALGLTGRPWGVRSADVTGGMLVVVIVVR